PARLPSARPTRPPQTRTAQRPEAGQTPIRLSAQGIAGLPGLGTARTSAGTTGCQAVNNQGANRVPNRTPLDGGTAPVACACGEAPGPAVRSDRAGRPDLGAEIRAGRSDGRSDL